MRRFGPEEVAELLRAVDRRIASRQEAVLIGGAAIGLLYAGTHATSDIDFYEVDPALLAVCAAAREETGLDVPVSAAGVAHLPESYRERCARVPIEGLTQLLLLAPERHDLAIAKLARGYAHDLDAIEEIHRHSPLELAILIERYSETYVTGSRSNFKLSLQLAVERLFGTEAASKLDAQLRD